MVRIQDIKPIPKYILKQIKKLDDNRYDKTNLTRFYKYLARFNKELVLVTVAVKSKKDEMITKQVAVHGLDSTNCLVRDMTFYIMAGYTVDWKLEGMGRKNRYYYYENHDWCEFLDKYYNVCAPIINIDFILRIKEFKYSQASHFNGHDIFKYLRLYRKYPQAEFLVKMGLKYYSTSKVLLQNLTKDKAFRKWFISNSKEIANDYFYIGTIMSAYKNNKSLKETQIYEQNKKEFFKSESYKYLRRYLNKEEFEKFFKYIDKQNASYYSYRDYFRACIELGLDMNIDKNRYPKEFRRWHDIRIDELEVKRIKESKKKEKQFKIKFEKVANKYLSLQRNLNDMYVAIIAKTPKDLKLEGEKLHHCVGRMGYDQKFAREESLIFFIRNKETPTIPLVTIEYSIKKKSVLQCYGDHDSKPSEDILNFVNKVWLPYANRKIKKVA